MGPASEKRDLSGKASANDVPCSAVIVHAQSLGMRDPHGKDVYAIALQVIVGARPAQHVRIGSHVPAAALGLLVPGTVLPARLMPDGEVRELVIDWQAALAQAADRKVGPERRGGEDGASSRDRRGSLAMDCHFFDRRRS
jgi:hypothetical protein